MVKACGQFVMVGGMLPMEFEREDDPVRMLQSNKAYFREHKAMNKPTNRFHVRTSVESISSLTTCGSVSDFTVYETLGYRQL